MKLVGSSQQQRHDYLYDASGTIAAGGNAQLVLGQSMARSFLLIQNLSSFSMFVEIGSVRATCTISGGAVTSGGFTISNGGFNFTKPPVIRFEGGGPPQGGNPTFLGGNQPNYPAPSNAAQAHAVLGGGAVTSIVLDNPGSGYLIAPYMLIINNDLDPYGCAVPTIGSGIYLPAGSPALIWNGTACPTDPVSIICESTGAGFTCKWMD